MPFQAAYPCASTCGHPGGLRGGDQMIDPLGTQPVGDPEPPIDALEVGRAGVRRRDRGHLVHDRVGVGGRDRLADGCGIQPVHDDGPRAHPLPDDPDPSPAVEVVAVTS